MRGYEMSLGLRALKAAAFVLPASRRRDAWGAIEVARRVSEILPPVRVALRLGFAPALTVLCAPSVPSRHQSLFKLCAALGYRMTGDGRAPHALAFHNASNGGACALPIDVPVINRKCDDVSKAKVARVFERVFGYPLALDPLTHQGPMVEKSDANYRHDGRVILGPLQPHEVDAERVYQRLIASVEDGYAVDFRTPIYDGVVPIVIEKRRPEAIRFASEHHKLRLREPREVYSDEELSLLATFVREFGMDYGELDVLRDTDGRIYVVDANNTPAGPAKELSSADKRRALDRMIPPFVALVHARLAEPGRTLPPAAPPIPGDRSAPAPH